MLRGPLNTHSAYRSELGGITGLAMFFGSIIIPLSSPNQNQFVVSDCLSALTRLTTSAEYTKTSIQHMDLIGVICDLWSSSTFTPIPFHVYGHQDSSPSCTSSNLALEVQLNCRMELLAKQIALHAIIHNNLLPPRFHTSLGFGTVQCHDKLIANCLQKDLYSTIMQANYSCHISKALEVSPEELESLVNWDCYRLSRSTARFGMSKFISKFIGKDIASGVVMKRRNNAPTQTA